LKDVCGGCGEPVVGVFVCVCLGSERASGDHIHGVGTGHEFQINFALTVSHFAQMFDEISAALVDETNGLLYFAGCERRAGDGSNALPVLIPRQKHNRHEYLMSSSNVSPVWHRIEISDQKLFNHFRVRHH